MTTEDDEFLKDYNTKRPANAYLSEDDFERLMEVFEDTAAESAPYAEVDNTFVPFELMLQAVSHHIREKPVQAHAKAIYEYWRSRRQATGNRSLHPSLKFETHQEHDDMDPYVCFRRREVRQTRKTRARDVQVADKLKKLRRELEDGRQLVVFAHGREIYKRELLKANRLVYEQRAKLKETKLKLNIKTDDDDLVDIKPAKRPKTEPQHPPRATTHSQLRLTVRPDGGRSMEPVELTLLRDKQAERELEFKNNIELKVQDHRRWNSNYVDLTADPLPPVKKEQEQNFRPAKTTYLMTPPASASDSMEVDEPPPAPERSIAPFVFAAAQLEDSDQEEMPSFRRRVGRLGRLFIDRRPGKSRTGLSSPPRETPSLQSDRWKYDDDDDDDETPVYKIDTNSLMQMKFRSTIPPPASLLRRPGALDIAQIQAANRTVLPQTLPQAQALLQAAQAKAQVAQGQGQATQIPLAHPTLVQQVSHVPNPQAAPAVQPQV
jgi:enhancer of polycomb-like protein